MRAPSFTLFDEALEARAPYGMEPKNGKQQPRADGRRSAVRNGASRRGIAMGAPLSR